jgi:hypothetical protein
MNGGKSQTPVWLLVDLVIDIVYILLYFKDFDTLAGLSDHNKCTQNSGYTRSYSLRLLKHYECRVSVLMNLFNRHP